MLKILITMLSILVRTWQRKFQSHPHILRNSSLAIMPRIFFLRPVHDEEIRNIITPLKEEAPCADYITANVLTCALNYIVNHLTHIRQLSFSHGYFPSDLKLAKIVLLYKFQDPCLVNNYCPISLPTVSKRLCTLDYMIFCWNLNFLFIPVWISEKKVNLHGYDLPNEQIR